VRAGSADGAAARGDLPLSPISDAAPSCERAAVPPDGIADKYPWVIELLGRRPAKVVAATRTSPQRIGRKGGALG
jgi:hypothetical protein